MLWCSSWRSLSSPSCEWLVCFSAVPLALLFRFSCTAHLLRMCLPGLPFYCPARCALSRRRLFTPWVVLEVSLSHPHTGSCQHLVCWPSTHTHRATGPLLAYAQAEHLFTAATQTASRQHLSWPIWQLAFRPLTIWLASWALALWFWSDLPLSWSGKCWASLHPFYLDGQPFYLSFDY